MIGTVEGEMREVDADVVSGILHEFEEILRNRGIKLTAARWRVEEEPPKEVPAIEEVEVEEGAEKTE